MAERFDFELEADVLAACLRDPAFVKRALPVLRRHDFSDSIRSWVWNVISDCYSTTREIPSGRIFGVRMDRDFKEDEHDLVIDALVSLRRRKVIGAGNALVEIRRFVRMSAARRAVVGATNDLDKGDIESALAMIAEADKEAKSADLLDEPESWSATYEDRLADYLGAPERLCFPTPLPTINRMIGGGLRSGAVGIIVAFTNVGKSAFVVGLGFHGLMRAKAVVVHVCTEETKRDCSARYDSLFTRIDREKLLTGDLSTEEQQQYRGRFERMASIIGDRLVVHEIEPKQPISGVRTVVELARENFPDTPILVIIDSADHLKPPDRMESHRLSQSAVYWYLLSLAKDQTLAPIAVWSTVQAPTKYAGRKLDRAAVSESIDKMRVAAVGLGLSEYDGDHDQGGFEGKPIEVGILKNRQGKVNRYRLFTRADLGSCEFREMSGHEVEEEL